MEDVFIPSLPEHVRHEIIRVLRRAARGPGGTKRIKGSVIDAYVDQIDGLVFERPLPRSDPKAMFDDVVDVVTSAALRERLRDGLCILPPTFVSYEQFAKNARTMFESLLPKLDPYDHVVCYVHPGKSNTWMTWNFLKYVRDVHPNAYPLLRRKIAFVTSQTIDFDSYRVLARPRTTALFLDDCAFSGSQLTIRLAPMLPYIDATEIILAVVYCTTFARAQFERAGVVNVVSTKRIRQLTAAEGRRLLELDIPRGDTSDSVPEKPRKFELDGMRGFRSLFEAFGLYAPTRTVFEHKLPDEISTSRYLNTDLASIAARIRKAPYYASESGETRTMHVRSYSGSTFALGKDYCGDDTNCFSTTAYADLDGPW